MLNSKNAAIKQVFTFLMVAILLGLIFLFGIRSMSGIVEDTCKAEKTLFIKSLNEYVSKYNTYGTKVTESMVLPCDSTAICFVDIQAVKTKENNLQAESTWVAPSINPVISASVAEGVEKNIFLMNGNVAEPIGYSEKLIVGADDNEDIVCVTPIGKKVNVKFMGKGKTTQVTIG